MTRLSEITWDAAPVLSDHESMILWYGTTITGQRVYERYARAEPLYDARSHYEIDEVEP